ncbi:MAG: GNAT family N-acetyltransferase [Bacillota bacterium]|nr:GNAT family N-acetyltransferase [Bacillota bacterium]
MIRLLNPKDAGSFRKIRLEALKNHPEAFSTSFEEEQEFSLESFEERLNRNYSYTFGAFEGEKSIGIVTMYVEQRAKLKHRANIVGMYISQEKRREGFGRSLMLEAIKKAKEIERVEQIHLTVTSSNEAAKKLYLSLGFQTYAVDQNALKIGHTYFDDELMVLKM